MVIYNFDIIDFKSKAIACPCFKSVKAIDSARRESIRRYRVGISSAIGFNQINVHRVRHIDFIIHPRIPVIIYMPNEHTLIRQTFIKTSILTEFNKVIFIVIVGCQHKSIIFLNSLQDNSRVRYF